MGKNRQAAMTEYAMPEFRGRFAKLPRSARDALIVIAKSTLAPEVDPIQHGQLVITSVAAVDAEYGEGVRIEMGWCLEAIDDHPIAEWVASQS